MSKLTRADVDKFSLYGTLAGYQWAAGRSAEYPGKGTRVGLNFTAFGLLGEAGEIAGHLAKSVWHGDGEHDLTPEQRQLIKKEIGDVLWYVAALCAELGIPMEEVALQNLNKLVDRTERGVLRGNGDNR